MEQTVKNATVGKSSNQRWALFKARYLTPKTATSFLWKIVRAVIIIGLCYIILYPFFIKIINSFKTYEDFMDPTVRFLPKHFTWENIKYCMKEMDYWRALGNTAMVSVILGLIQMIVSAVVGYGLARFKFKGRGLLFFMVVFTMIVPSQTIILPLYTKFKLFLGVFPLLNTPWPLVILSLTSLGIKNGLYIFLFRQFFKNMPKELEEASYLDGCGPYRTFFTIMLPASLSIMVTVFLLSLSWQWTDTTFSTLFLRDIQAFKMLATVTSQLGNGDGIPILLSNRLNTGSILAILPLALIYIVAQKFFVQSIDRAGIVG